MKEYTGMTVNERLYVSGLMEKFDKAIKEKNIDAIELIIKEVELNDLSIDPILEHFGLKREK